MNNITQRDEESLEESEDNYCTDGNSDEEATILTMYKNCDGTVWSKSSFNSLQRCRSVENIACFETVLILQKIFLENVFVRTFYYIFGNTLFLKQNGKQVTILNFP